MMLKRRSEAKRIAAGVAGLTGVVSYLLLAFSWFDHDIGTPLASLPPIYMAAVLVLSLGSYLGLRGLPRPFEDRRDTGLLFLLGLQYLELLPATAPSLEQGGGDGDVAESESDE